jgi:hypothetical protein
LTTAERSAVGGEPDSELEIELESRLTEGLKQIPDAPVASNFTARVMAAVEREEAGRAESRTRPWNWRVLLPRVVATAAILVFTGTVWERYEVRSQHSILVKNIAQVTYSKQVPSLDAIYNFDAIQRMSQPVAADKELLALLQ